MASWRLIGGVGLTVRSGCRIHLPASSVDQGYPPCTFSSDVQEPYLTNNFKHSKLVTAIRGPTIQRYNDESRPREHQLPDRDRVSHQIALLTHSHGLRKVIAHCICLEAIEMVLRRSPGRSTCLRSLYCKFAIGCRIIRYILPLSRAKPALLRESSD